MSALVTHMAMGLLLGLAIGLRGRQLLFALLLPALPDVDHLPMYGSFPFLEVRGTFHNVFVVTLVPIALALWMRRAGVAEAWQRLAWAAPLLLASHVMLDLLPLDPLGGVGTVELFYPVSRAPITVPYHAVTAISPTEYSSFTLALLLLAGLAALTAWRIRAPTRRGPALALAFTWILLVPSLAAAGMVAPRSTQPNAVFSVTDAALALPSGHVVAVVHDLGGEGAGIGTLRFEASSGGKVLVHATNAKSIMPGGAWGIDLPVPNARELADLEIRLSAGSRTYVLVAAPIVRGHVDDPLSLVDGTVRNDGALAIPSGALSAVGMQDGREVANLTLERRLDPGDGWRLPMPSSLGGTLSWEIRAVDDGYVYARA